LLAEDFEGDASRWSPGLTSDWVLTNDGSVVYAQRSTAGDARSVSGVSTRDQIIQARAKATSFAPGGERWFGLMTRFVDDQNYYYVTVRNTNQISLRALVGGAIRVLDTAPMTVRTGTWYTVRMEAVGALLRVYVNNRLVLEATDTTHAQGRYGFRTFRTAARYDDFTALKP
jgi:pectate lyase